MCYQHRSLLYSLQILYLADIFVFLSNNGRAKWKLHQPQKRNFLRISTMFTTGVFIMMMYYENSWCSMALTLILPPHQSHVTVTPLCALSNLEIMLIMQNNILKSNFIFITKFNCISTWKIVFLLGVYKTEIGFITSCMLQWNSVGESCDSTAVLKMLSASMDK